jgi:hypothetical protein
MHTAIIADHPWHFHLTTGQNTGILHDITDTGTRTMAAIIASGDPMTADTSIKAIANMRAGMAISTGGTGNPMTEDNTVTKAVVTAVTLEGDSKGYRNHA